MAEARNPEFSRLLSRDEIGRGSRSLELAADEGERAALARRFGLLALDRLEARLTLSPQQAGDLLRVEGRLRAAATQACVVTLEPVAEAIDQEIGLLYSLAAEDWTAEREQVVDPEGEDPPEPLGPEGLDLGEALAQQLAVALEPYPRAPGADLEAEIPEDRAGEEPSGPFAALAALKQEK